MIVFSGCIAGEEKGTETTAPSTTSATSTTEATVSTTASSAPEVANTPPTATLTANIENGSVPLNVTFNFTADDADADQELNWSLDADGDGTADATGTREALPGNYTHSFATEGLFNATFLVDDGESNTTANITIMVSAAAPTGPIQETDGSFVASVAVSCLGGPVVDPLDGIEYAAFDINPLTLGLPFEITFEGEIVGVGIEFFDASGGSIDYWESDGAPIADEVPAGSATANVWGCGAADVSFHYVSPAPA